MSKPRLLLASESPRRRELVALLGLPFQVTVANVTEAPQPDEPPTALVVRLSRAKARAGWCRQRQRAVENASGSTIIVGCDTVVALDDEVLGKPRGATEATAMLRRLRGRAHTVYSAVTLLEPADARALTDVARTQVAMRAYSDAEISTYVASGDPLDKAGAYAIQHPGFRPVAELRGCYASVIGLPLCHLTRCLRAWGTPPLRDVAAACQAHTGRHCAACTDVLAGQPSKSPL